MSVGVGLVGLDRDDREQLSTLSVPPDVMLVNVNALLHRHRHRHSLTVRR